MQGDGTVFVRPGTHGAVPSTALREDRAALDGRFATSSRSRSRARRPDSRTTRCCAAWKTATPSRCPREARLRRSGASAREARARGARRHVFGRITRRDRACRRSVVGLGAGTGRARAGARTYPDRRRLVRRLPRRNRPRPRRGQPPRPALAAGGPLGNRRRAARDQRDARRHVGRRRTGRRHVLETTHAARDTQVLRIFEADGDAKGVAAIAEHASQVRLGADGSPLVLQQPSDSGCLRPTRADASRPRRAERRRPTSRGASGGNEVVVLRRGTEIRVSVRGIGALRAQLADHEPDAVAEVQLAEPLGRPARRRLRASTRTRRTSSRARARPDRRRAAARVDSADWAETAPLSRFRLVGSSLYQLGSTPAACSSTASTWR